jgi:hypothetical protein
MGIAPGRRGGMITHSPLSWRKYTEWHDPDRKRVARFIFKEEELVRLESRQEVWAEAEQAKMSLKRPN